MTDGFKKAIGLLMFHNIPFEYNNSVYGEFLLGGHFVNHDRKWENWTWEIDDAPSNKHGIAFQPTYFTHDMDHSISVNEAIKKIIEIENKALTDKT